MDNIHNDPFFRVPRTMRSTVYGDIEIPTMYYKVNTLTALFTSSYDQAARKLTELSLKPGLFWQGKAVVAIAFYEYLDTSIGPYNEVALAIPALPIQQSSLPFGGWLDLWSSVQTRRIGHYILNLPVTTELAWFGGQEFLGLPKFVTEIPFHLDSHAFHSDVLDPNRRDLIVSLAGKLGMGVPAPSMNLALFSVLKGKKLRTTVIARGAVRLRSKGDLRLCIGGSDHEMAHNLQDLRLDDQQPFLVMETHRFQSRLNAGEEFDWTAK